MPSALKTKNTPRQERGIASLIDRERTKKRAFCFRKAAILQIQWKLHRHRRRLRRRARMAVPWCVCPPAHLLRREGPMPRRLRVRCRPIPVPPIILPLILACHLLRAIRPIVACRLVPLPGRAARRVPTEGLGPIRCPAHPPRQRRRRPCRSMATPLVALRLLTGACPLTARRRRTACPLIPECTPCHPTRRLLEPLPAG